MTQEVAAKPLATVLGSPKVGASLAQVPGAPPASPVLPARRAARAARDMSKEKVSELEMWRKWKDGGQKPADLEPLLVSLKPLIQRRVSTFAKRVPIPTPVLEAEAQKIVITALEKYNPEKAQMGTHLTNHLMGLQRVVIKNQNVSRITEDRARRIGDYNRAVAALQDVYGEAPTDQQIADKMMIGVKKVRLLRREIRKDLLASSSPVEDPFIDETPKHREVLAMLRFEFQAGSDELKVLEYLQGINGKPHVTETGKIARALGWSDSKVSQVRGKIGVVVQRYMDA